MCFLYPYTVKGIIWCNLTISFTVIIIFIIAIYLIVIIITIII